jgi:subtilisin family serine protease
MALRARTYVMALVDFGAAKIMRVFRAALGLSAAIIFLLNGTDPARSQVRQSITAEPRILSAPVGVDAPAASELIDKAQRSGVVRVIARVARPLSAPAGPLSEVELAVANNVLIDRAKALGVASAEAITGLPISVIEVSADQLRELLAAGLISDVVEDVPERAGLEGSIPLINADGPAVVLGATGAGQGIAILDTGVQANHPFFGGRVIAEACFSSNSAAQGSTTVCPGGVTTSTTAGSAAPCANTGCGHGTHVAGIAAGSDASRHGVAPQANIIAIQVFSLFTDSPPPGPRPCAAAGLPSPCVLSFPSDQIRALQQVVNWQTTFAISSVNISIWSGNFPTCDLDLRKGLIDQLRTARVATVVISGNGGSNTGVGAPGCITTAITVGNTTKADVVAASSDSAAVVDLLAPGTNINSSVPGGGFAQMSGTSMAAPHVAGAIAVLRSIKNDLTVDQIEDILESTGVRLTDPKNNLSFPRLNLQAAVLNVSGLSGALAAGVQYVLSDSEGALLPPIVHYVLD